MAQYEYLPIYKKMFDLVVYIENIIRGFSRYHKYTMGIDSRKLSRETKDKVNLRLFVVLIAIEAVIFPWEIDFS